MSAEANESESQFPIGGCLGLIQSVTGTGPIPSPGTTLRLCLDLLNDDRPDTRFVVETIESDHHLGCGLLAVANCLHGTFPEWKSVRGTLEALGHATTCECLWVLALSDTLQCRWSREFDDGLSDLKPDRVCDQLWRHSLLTGVLTLQLLDALEMKCPFGLAAGMAHDIGHLLIEGTGRELDIVWHSEHDGLADQPGHLPSDKDHGRLGGSLLTCWNAPPELVQAGFYHHHPRLAVAAHRPLVHVVRLADLYTEHIERHPSEMEFGVSNHPVWMDLIELSPRPPEPGIDLLIAERLPDCLQITDRLVGLLAR
ncbi:MAG: HDOD domain-containing protein [Planctomycetaceae bacterium]